MSLHQEKILQIAQAFFKNKDYREVVFGKPYFVPKSNKGSNEPLDYWVIPIEHRIFDVEDAFLYIDDETGNIMYLLTGHGRKYINGESESDPEDDGEDWDDF